MCNMKNSPWIYAPWFIQFQKLYMHDMQDCENIFIKIEKICCGINCFNFIPGMSCNRMGTQTCLRCKICFCDDHVKRKGVKYVKGKVIPCPKCNYDTSETKAMSMSSKSDVLYVQHIKQSPKLLNFTLFDSPTPDVGKRQVIIWVLIPRT